ncbi:MAG TPA: tripartite tricarboxylate transporter substrate-binding protein [Xanthobacteraceae bacterium]|nr:tripartite tricarboxylate transporter substrate-binding protein [Xanthobacteraceae bacterium]
MRKLLCAAIGGCAALLAAAGVCRADPIADFYHGKTIRFVIGSNTGGSYDTYSRALAAYLGKHIPGAPAVVTENMPGASGTKSANYLGEVAPKDGTVIGLFNQSMAQRQKLYPNTIHIDLGKFSWIGAMNRSTNVFITWHTSGVRTIEDAKKKEVAMGALAANGGNATYPWLLNAFLGTKFKVVLGYPGGNTIELAMERGEVEGRGAVVWSGLKAGWPQWIQEKKVNILVQIALKKEPDLPDVPLLTDLARTPDELKVMRFLSADSAMGFPVTAPPGIPADRLAALRKAFMDTMNDPEFLKAVEQRKLDIEPSSGEEVQRIVEDITSTPDELIAKINAALEAAGAKTDKN